MNSSAFWGALVQAATFASDPEFVAKDAIAWLLLCRAGVFELVENGDDLAAATFVQRVNTVGGLAPSIGCNSPADIGTTAFVPYEADYVFWRSFTTATTAAAERRSGRESTSSFAPFFLARITRDHFHHDVIRTEAGRASRATDAPGVAGGQVAVRSLPRFQK